VVRPDGGKREREGVVGAPGLTGMEEEMQVLYTEGLATHGDPESCVVARKGGGEALTGARAGRAIEPRNHRDRDADAVYEAGRQYRQWRCRESLAGPARSENQGMYGTSMRENREGRPEKVKAAILRCTALGSPGIWTWGGRNRCK